MNPRNLSPRHASFAFTGGAAPVLMLTGADVERYLDPRLLFEGLEAGFGWLELGEVQTPPRPKLRVADRGFSLAMSAWRPGMQLTVKIVNVFEGNHARALPSHQALISLFDPDTGAPTCVMDGASITGLRTAAAAMLSVRLLSRAESRTATVIGAGVQGRDHLRLLPLVRNIARINVCSRNPEQARRLAAGSETAHATTDLEAAVRESDIVCLTTASPSPVIQAGWLKPGAHVTSVGYAPPGSELPRELARHQRIFVETLDAFQPSPVGCSELAGLDPATGTTLGAVTLGRKPGRLSPTEITVYKAMGNAMEDMVAANLVFQRAIHE